MSVAGYILVALVAYLCGSLPTGHLLAKARGIDIRAVGSGNIGATNVFRVLGWPAGVSVLVVDVAKGALPVVLARWAWAQFDLGAGANAIEWAAIVAGFCSVLGHNFTIWLGFKGGKGIATSAGVLAALVPLAFLVVLGVFVVVLAVTRYVSLASITGAAALPIAAWATKQSSALIAITTAMAALAIFKHKANIVRLLKGTENRLGTKKETSQRAFEHSPGEERKA